MVYFPNMGVSMDAYLDKHQLHSFVFISEIESWTTG